MKIWKGFSIKIETEYAYWINIDAKINIFARYIWYEFVWILRELRYVK